MKKLLKTIVHDYGWVHLSLGLIGNFSFFIGSVLFLPSLERYKTTGVWLFILGSLLMFVGSLGNFFVSISNKND